MHIREKLAVSIYLVQMMLADGLYWLIRDYYRNNQKHAQDQRYEEDKNEAMYILYGVERG